MGVIKGDPNRISRMKVVERKTEWSLSLLALSLSKGSSILSLCFAVPPGIEPGTQ